MASTVFPTPEAGSARHVLYNAALLSLRIPSLQSAGNQEGRHASQDLTLIGKPYTSPTPALHQALGAPAHQWSGWQTPAGAHA